MTIIEKLAEYEHTALDFYAEEDKSKRVLLDQGTDLDTIMDGMPKKLGNPYMIISRWASIEIHDLEALRQSIDDIKATENKIAEIRKEIGKLKEYVGDLNSEKTTFTKFWRAVTFR